MYKKMIIFALFALMLTGCASKVAKQGNTDTDMDKNSTVTADNSSSDEFTVKTAEISETEWYLALVNREYILPDDFTVDLTDVASNVKIDSRIAFSYQDMYDAALADGVRLNPISGYRTVDYQQQLFSRRVNQYLGYGYTDDDAAAIVNTYTAKAGQSEHNLGLAIDFYDSSTDLTSAFEKTKQGKWLKENSYKYGFIMRYSSDKTDITGVIHEPWHYRYVGLYAAEEMYKSGQCLEEYLGKARTFDIDIDKFATTSGTRTTVTGTEETAPVVTKTQTQKTEEEKTTAEKTTTTTTTEKTTESTTPSTTASTSRRTVIYSSVYNPPKTTTKKTTIVPSKNN